MTAGRFWIRRPRPPTRSGRGRAAWPGSPSSSRRTTRKSARSCERGPGFAQEVSSLLDQIKPTLPMLLANLTTIGQILVTYNPSLEQLLVIFPEHHRRTAVLRSPEEQPHGPRHRRLRADHHDPPPCTVGFLPPSQWRSPADDDRHRHTGRPVLQAAAGLPDRGARRPQLPVHGHPGKRAPTVELCNDPEGYQADRDLRQHDRPVPIRPEHDRAGHPAR